MQALAVEIRMAAVQILAAENRLEEAQLVGNPDVQVHAAGVQPVDLHGHEVRLSESMRNIDEYRKCKTKTCI